MVVEEMPNPSDEVDGKQRARLEHQLAQAHGAPLEDEEVGEAEVCCQKTERRSNEGGEADAVEERLVRSWNYVAAKLSQHGHGLALQGHSRSGSSNGVATTTLADLLRRLEKEPTAKVVLTFGGALLLNDLETADGVLRIAYRKLTHEEPRVRFSDLSVDLTPPMVAERSLVSDNWLIDIRKLVACWLSSCERFMDPRLRQMIQLGESDQAPLSYPNKVLTPLTYTTKTLKELNDAVDKLRGLSPTVSAYDTLDVLQNLVNVGNSQLTWLADDGN
ncbi:hypothetical protein HKX48_002952 [Thoreauomyces humboldtii]|nr:hypothetical protein HKX48_002952 [Thoreauomyces humboldtii]